MRKTFSVVLALVALGAASAVYATPYASGITQAGSTVNFVLNQAADNVKVTFNNGDVLDLGALPKGTGSFNMAGYTSYSIRVASSTPAGWTKISDDTNNASKYFAPRGVSVNRNPGSSNFGRLYVGEALGGLSGTRTTTDGLYIMTADQADVTGQGDTARGGGVDWTTGGVNSPFRVTVAPDDNVFIADWSDLHSGVWTSDANGSGTFSELLDNTGRTTTGLVAGLHGSVPGLCVEGTGANRKMYTLDEDYNAGSGTGSVLRYDIGNATSGYNTAPVESTKDLANNIANLRADVVRDQYGTFWVAQYRSTESAANPALTRWMEGGSAPMYNSGADAGLAALLQDYGSLDINNATGLIAMGARGSRGVYIINISNPAAPVLLTTLAGNGVYVQDVAFDAAGNLYVVSTAGTAGGANFLRIWSPGGNWVTVTGSDGSFIVAPEPASLALMALGGLALLRRRR